MSTKKKWSTQPTRFDKLHELLKSNEAYESSCARKAKLFDEIVEMLSASIKDCDKLRQIQSITKKSAGGSCGG